MLELTESQKKHLCHLKGHIWDFSHDIGSYKCSRCQIQVKRYVMQPTSEIRNLTITGRYFNEEERMVR